MSKNNSVNFWRFVFTMSIVVFHFADDYKQFNTYFHCNVGWRLAVEFFFVVSGFLLAYKCENSDLSAWEYTKHRYKRFFPAYFLMTVVMTIFWVIEQKMNFNDTCVYILNLSDDIVLMQGTALNYVNNNGPAWYISSLIICGYFIFYLLRKHKETFSHFVAPLICLVAYSYINKDLGSLRGNIANFSQTLGISIAVIRGFGGMCAGVVSYELFKRIKKIKFTKLGMLTAHIGEFAGFGIMLVYTFFKGSTKMDFIFVMFFVLCTAIAFSREKKNIVLNNKLVNYLANISFSIYLTHVLVLRIFEYHFFPQNEYSNKVFLLYIVTSIVSGAVCDFISSRMAAFLGKKSKQLGGFFIKAQKISKKA